jgi:hypothetical protein
MATKRRKSKTKSPCRTCKGFSVPARRVRSVARDPKGRFRKRSPW